jgi:hypothetical protein
MPKAAMSKKKKDKHKAIVAAAKQVEALNQEVTVLMDQTEDLAQRLAETLCLLRPEEMKAKRDTLANEVLWKIMIAMQCGGLDGIEQDWRKYLADDSMIEWIRIASAIRDTGIETDRQATPRGTRSPTPTP